MRTRLCWASLLLLNPFLAGSASAQLQAPARESSTRLQMNDNDYSSTGRKVISLKATVQSRGTPVQSGLVIFCDSDARFCLDSAVLGKAQLDRTGTAVLRLTPAAIGQHRNVKAVFKGTWTYAGSSSDIIKNTVPDPPYPPTMTLTSSGTPAAYSLTATVTGGAYSDTAIPTGTVDFVDTTTSADLGTVNLTGHELVTYNNVGGGTTDSQPVSMVLADFNNDGLPDVATANAGAATVSVLLSDGFGGFNAAPSLSLLGVPQAIASADFNGDGNADIVVSNITPTSGISVYLGNGDGTFRAPSHPATCQPAAAIVTGDFNHDGKADVAVACGQVPGHQLTILLGKGDGTFSPATSQPAASGPVSLAVADFNGDGIEDLAVGEATTEAADILLGKGDGTFHKVQSIGTGTYNVPVAIATGDFNSDGKVDLTVINNGANTAVTLLNNGSGIFHQSSIWHVGPGPTSVLASGLSGSGNVDLAIPISGWNQVMLLYGTGHGTFHLGGGLAVGKQPSAIVYGVLMAPENYDPFASLVIANKGTSTLTQIEPDYAGQSTATLNNVSKIGTGTYQVVGNYSGDETWDPDTSNAVTLKSFLQSATTLTLSASTVTTATTVTLTGKVTANGHPVTSGVVRFCNATVASCMGSAWYGTASLNSSGIATLKRKFAAGTYHINGRFPATSTDTKSTSATSTLTVKP